MPKQSLRLIPLLALYLDPVTGDPIVLEEEQWKVITVNNKGAANGHVGHHGPADDQTLKDFEITNDDETNNPTDENDSVADCEALDEALGEA